jgi:hypothetical protein
MIFVARVFTFARRQFVTGSAFFGLLGGVALQAPVIQDAFTALPVSERVPTGTTSRPRRNDPTACQIHYLARVDT